MRPRTLMLLSAAGVVTLGCLLWFWSLPTPAPAAGASESNALNLPRATCSFADSKPVAWDARIELSVVFEMDRPEFHAARQLFGDEGEVVHYRITARELTSDNGLSLVKVRIANRTVGASSADGTSVSTSLLKVSQDCRVLDVAHDKSTPPAVAKANDALLRSLGFELAAKRRYKRTERDETGMARMIYAHGDGDGRLFRRTVGYDSVHQTISGAKETKVLVREGLREIVLGPGPWFDSQSDRFGLVFKRGAQVWAKSSGRLEVHKVDVAEGSLEGTLDVSQFVWGPPADAHSDKPEAQWPGLAGMALELAMDEALRLQGTEKVPKAAAERLLRQWLRANPGKAKLLAEQLARPGLSSGARTMLVSALVTLGNAEAQAALLHIHGSPDMSESNRVLATSGFFWLDKPEEAVVDGLAAAARRQDGTTSPNDMVGNVSMMAIGSLHGDHAKTNPALADKTAALLRERLALPEVDAQREALLAIANTDGDTFLDDVLPYVKHDEPRLRAAAAKAMQHSGSEEVAKLYTAWLGTEPKLKVVRAIGKSLQARIVEGQQLDQGALMTIAAVLSKTTDPRSKNILINALGQASASNAAAKKLLIERFRQERDPKTMALYGIYATADELVP